MYKMSAAGVKLLQSFEGCVLVPYNDAGGNATIGIGHLIHYGNLTAADVERYEHFRGPHGHRRPHHFDLEDAHTYLQDDLHAFERDLTDYIHVALNQHQVDALLDLTYNCGPAPLAGRLGSLLNDREYQAAADDMLNWDHLANGTVLPALQQRRNADRALFLAIPSDR
jgi:lysozyme